MSDVVSQAQLQQALNELEGRLRPLVSQLQGEAWHEVGAAHEPAFQNSWRNVGGAYETAAFRFVNPRLVALKGSVQSGNLPSVVFTLPRAYWPAKQRRIVTNVDDNAGHRYVALLFVDQTGNVYVFSEGTGAPSPIPQASLEVMFAL